MNDLATRIEQATGPDRELDRDIARLFGWHRVEPRHTRGKHGAWISPNDWIGEYGDGKPMLDSMHGTTMHREVPHYTASLDAAMTLAENCHVILNIAEDNITTAIVSGTQGIGDTPALALCAAAIRART